jgi:hypothetical protein
MTGARDPDHSDLQAQFSVAYVEAVAAAAGFFVQVSDRGLDKDGIDATVMRRGLMGTARSPRLDLQIKSEGSAELAHDPFPHVLKIKGYNDLRATGYQVPRLLVVVLVPEDVSDWVVHGENELVLRRCGYWLNLVGDPEVQATRRTVHLPRAQVFDVAGLTALMHRVAEGQSP